MVQKFSKIDKTLVSELDSEAFGSFSVYHHCDSDDRQRQRLLFYNEEFYEKNWEDVKGYYCPRIGFRVCDNEAMFLGMLLPKKLRGKGLSALFLQSFNDFVQHFGLEFYKTGLIHKPILAKKLLEWGFKPQDTSTEVEIMPCSRFSSFELPKVKFINPSKAYVSHLFDVVDENTANEYPLTDSKQSHVFLNTKYIKAT